MTISDNEIELIESSKKGDKVAFAKLVRTYEDYLKNYLIKVVKVGVKPDIIDDISQETWVKAYNSLGKIKNNSSFKSWLTRIVLNDYYDYLRKNGEYNNNLSIDNVSSNDEFDNKLSFDVPDTRNLPEEELLSKEIQEVIDRGIKNLPEKHRVIIMMRHFQNLSYDEIATVTDLSIGTVKSRIARAREKLMLRLSSYFGERLFNIKKG